MTPKWIVQADCEDLDVSGLVSEAKKNGCEVVESFHRFGMDLDLAYSSDRNPIILYGSIGFVLNVQRRSSFPLIGWFNPYNLRCSTYYAHLGEHLLSREYAMMPIGDLVKRFETLVGASKNGSLFIRPNIGAKPFVGQIVTASDWHKIKSISDSISPEELVVVAPSKPIDAEFRFVVCNRHIADFSHYDSPYTENNKITKPSTSSLRLARKIANTPWQPDTCYTVDIAESDGYSYLVEINSFSSSGFYGCDPANIVSCACVASIKDWTEIYGN